VPRLPLSSPAPVQNSATSARTICAAFDQLPRRLSSQMGPKRITWMGTWSVPSRVRSCQGVDLGVRPQFLLHAPYLAACVFSSSQILLFLSQKKEDTTLSHRFRFSWPLRSIHENGGNRKMGAIVRTSSPAQPILDTIYIYFCLFESNRVHKNG
jgi:hypothetical protein